MFDTEDEKMLEEFDRFVENDKFNKSSPTKLALAAFGWAWEASRKTLMSPDMEQKLQEFLADVDVVYGNLVATDLSGDVGSSILKEVMLLQQAIAKVKEKTK